MDREPIVLGGADGLICGLGLVLGLVVSSQSPHALWHASWSAGLAEFAGMTAAVKLSDDGTSWPAALACGLASLLTIALPAVPYLITSGTVALAAAMAITTALGCVICWLRPQHGWQAVAQTFGLLAIAAVLSIGGNLL